MNSRRDIFLTVISFFLVILILSQIGIYYTLSKSRPEILKLLTDTSGHRFDLKGISFNFLQGIRLKGLSVFYQDEPSIFIKDASASIRLLPLIFKRTLAIQININEGVFLLNKKEAGVNLQVIFSDIYKKKILSTPSILNIFKQRWGISIKVAKFIYTDNAFLEKNMHILIKNSRLRIDGTRFKFDGDIEFNYCLPDEVYISRFFKNKRISQQIHCSAMGNLIGEDLLIDLIVLNVGKDQILGTAVSKRFEERNPFLDISFMHYTLALDNIVSLKENLNLQGDIFCSLKLKGLMDEPKINFSGSLYYCSLRYASANNEVFDIKNLKGQAEYHDNQLRFDKAYLDLNAVPLDIQLLADFSDASDINLKVSVPQDFLVAQNLPLGKLEAIFQGKLKDTLQGNLSIDALYLRKDNNLNMQARFRNVEFNYRDMNEKRLKADIIELAKVSAIKTQALNFNNLNSRVSISKDKIEIKDLEFSGYNAKLSGGINLNTKDETSLLVALEGAGLDANTLMRDINISDKLLSGNMDIKVVFDNRKRDFLVGDCRIINGIANLNLVADILRLPSLRRVNFALINCGFSISKDKISMHKMKLNNPDITLDASWNTNGKIDGLLNLEVSSGLLSQSRPFKKLLNLTRTKKPYIDFDFSLGGIPKTVRAMWMKGEFKDKIKEGLPAWVKRKIERELDNLVDELSNK